MTDPIPDDAFPSPDLIARTDAKLRRKAKAQKVTGLPSSNEDAPGAFVIDIRNGATLRLDDFRAYMPMHSYIFIPSRELWPASSVNSRLPPVEIPNAKPIPATAWLDEHHPVEQMTWAPGMPMLIRDRLISHGGWIDRAGMTCFNLYQPPQIIPGDPTKAKPWRDHLAAIYPTEAAHIEAWFAHRVQRPGDKINHALLLGGAQGIGKDTLLAPLKHAVGPWNFEDVSPSQMLGRFNGFIKSVVLRISEARDLGDVDRYAFYEHMKVFTAAPPDVLRCDEKNLREHSVLNVTGIIITTNHKLDGIYLPADDRRHYVAWSDATKEEFPPEYWNEMYRWYNGGGVRHVAAYLANYDLSDFDFKAPPPRTAAFLDIVAANRSPEDAELADALDACKNPDVITLSELIDESRRAGNVDFANWLGERKNSRAISHRMQGVGYVSVRNDSVKDGLWKLRGRRQVVYARAELSIHDRISAARKLIR
jgi:hypothetical protein